MDLLRKPKLLCNHDNAKEDPTYYSPCIDAGTAKAAQACILILKLEESRNNSRRILKTDGALPKKARIHNYIILQMYFNTQREEIHDMLSTSR